jgi:hypothetical protein
MTFITLILALAGAAVILANRTSATRGTITMPTEVRLYEFPELGES